jgi:hypothetical protein
VVPVTARDDMELLAAVSCSMAVLLIMLCLFPGVTEIFSKVQGFAKRKGSRHRAGHRVQEDPQRGPDHGDQVEDTQRIETAA